MTRARTEMYLSVPQVTGHGAKQRETAPSPFLTQIPDKLRTIAAPNRTAGRAARGRHEGTTRSRTLPVTRIRGAAAYTSQPPRLLRTGAPPRVGAHGYDTTRERRRSTTMGQIGRGRMDATRAAKATFLPWLPPARTPPVTDPAPVSSLPEFVAPC